MKKNTIILVSVFILLLVLAFIILQRPGELSITTNDGGLMFKIDSAMVDKIAIQSSASAIVLEKRGAEWFVVQPVQYRADQSVVARIIQQVKAMSEKNIVSSKPEKHSVFQVDSSGTQVKLFEQNSERAAFVLGKMAQSYVETYVRRINSNDVILTEGVSEYMFKRPVKDWRDKTIYSTPRDNIKSIVYQYGDTTFTVSFQDSTWKIGKAKAKQVIVDGIVSTLSNFQADDFLDDNLVPFPKLMATISYAGIQLQISFDKNKNQYYIRTSNSPQIFIVEPWRANPILKRKPDIAEK